MSSFSIRKRGGVGRVVRRRKEYRPPLKYSISCVFSSVYDVIEYDLLETSVDRQGSKEREREKPVSDHTQSSVEMKNN